LQLDPSKRQAADEANRVGRKRASAVIIALLDEVLPVCRTAQQGA
jgi:hypothetical protein